MIQVTEHAISKLKEFAAAEDLPLIVRLKVLGGGCNGMTHDMCFEEVVLDTDEVIEINDIKIIIDQISYQYLENVCIDWIETTFGGGFKFLSPDIKSTCGCGHSVSY